MADLTRIAVSADYTIKITDDYVGVIGNSGVVTLTLPLQSTVRIGQVFTIKDEAGTALTYNVVIATQGGNTIQGGSTYSINVAYGTAEVAFTGQEFVVKNSNDPTVLTVAAGGTNASTAPMARENLGLSTILAPCRVATTGNVTLGSASEDQDDVALTVGDRVFVWKQTTASQNGIYRVATHVAPNVSLVRASDFAVGVDVVSGSTTTIVEGTEYHNVTFSLTTDDPIVVGTTPLTFSPTSGATDVYDVNGNKLLEYDTTALAVNYIAIGNNSTGSTPIVRAKGTDATVGLTLMQKGAEYVNLGDVGCLGVRLNNNQPITDVNAYSLISFNVRPIAVNNIEIGNGGTGEIVSVHAVGTDATINMDISAKGGSGRVYFASMVQLQDTRIQLGASGSSSVYDLNGKEILQFAHTSSAVNYIQVANANTGNPPGITAVGTDANIDLNIYSKGTSGILLNSTSISLKNDQAFYDSANQEILAWNPQPGAVNNWEVYNSTTGNPVNLSAVGTDGNIGLKFTAKGTAPITLQSSAIKLNNDQQINDSDGNTMLTWLKTGSAVNHLEIRNNSTGSAPTLTSIGTDSDIGINILQKGLATVNLGDAGCTGIRLNNNQPIVDVNANELVTFGVAPSAVNQIKISNSATGDPVSIQADGGDANIHLGIASQGTGAIFLLGSSTVFYNDQPISDSSFNEYITFHKATSAVNQISVSNAATGNAVSIQAEGDDTNVGLGFAAQGTGALLFDGSVMRLMSDQPITDHSNNELLAFDATPSAVNYAKLENSATGDPIFFHALGDDANVSLGLGAKGTGQIILVGTGVLLNSTQPVNDQNGAELLTFSASGSAVNQVLVTNSATGVNPSIAADGDDTNIALIVAGKGTGAVALGQATSVGIKLVADQPILDSSANELVKFTKAASAVNEVTIANAATGTGPTISATGGDTDIDLNLVSKGAGNVKVNGMVLDGLIEVSPTDGVGLAVSSHAVFIANRAYQVTAVKEMHMTAGAFASNLNISKETGTTAPGGGTDILTDNANAGFDMQGTANTVQSGTLTGTTANLQLAAGNRLSFHYTGTITAIAGVVVTITLKAI